MTPCQQPIGAANRSTPTLIDQGMSLFTTFALVLLVWQGFVYTKRETFCRDHKGDIVDWWVLYKQAGSLEYTYLSSKDALSADKRFTEPLREDRWVTHPDTSPFLRTVYGSNPYTEEERREKKLLDAQDNRMILAWNDQQPKGSAKSAKDKPPPAVNKRTEKHENFIDTVDPNMQETKLGDGQDMYGWGENVLVAHSKGILGMSVEEVDDDNGVANFYLITHSFPRTPNGLWEEDGEYPIKRRYVSKPKDFFGHNITTPQNKAQHAVCISMTQEVKLDDGEIVFDRKELDQGSMNLFSILNGLDIIGPSLTLTNYVPHLERFKIYHQLFNITDTWSSTDPAKVRNTSYSNVARIIPQDLPSSAEGNESSHAFPLWPSTLRTKIINGSLTAVSTTSRKEASLRNPQQIYATRCQVWERVEGRRDAGCYTSARLTSTNKQSKIVFDVDFKNALMKADTDDFIAARLIPDEDLDLATNDTKTPFKKYVSLMVVTQSWFDHATLGSHPRNIINNDKLQVKAWFHNNLGIRMPHGTVTNNGKVELGETVPQLSNSQDHSKWFLAYLYGQTGHFVPLAGVMDLNRNGKATRLQGREQGRGGMLFFTTHPAFVGFFMSLSPVIEDSSNFSNIPIEVFKKVHLPNTKKSVMAEILQFNPEGTAVRMRFSDCPILRTFQLPYCAIPDAAAAMLSKDTNTKTTGNPMASLVAFRLGSPNFRKTPFTPPRMNKSAAPRTTHLEKDKLHLSFAKKNLAKAFSRCNSADGPLFTHVSTPSTSSKPSTPSVTVPTQVSPSKKPRDVVDLTGISDSDDSFSSDSGSKKTLVPQRKNNVKAKKMQTVKVVTKRGGNRRPVKARR